MEDRLKQGQRVQYFIDSVNPLQGEGTVVGVASNVAPIIGRSYIIEPDKPISNEVYDYSHFIAWEFQLTKI